MLLLWSSPAETLLWFLLLGCVSAMPVCWAGSGGRSGVAAGEAEQDRFLLQAQPPLGHRDHLQRVLPVRLRAATCLLWLPWGAQCLNRVQQRRKDCKGSLGSVMLHPERGSPAEAGLLVDWCWKAAGAEGDKAQGSPERPREVGVPRGTPKLA